MSFRLAIPWRVGLHQSPEGVKKSILGMHARDEQGFVARCQEFSELSEASRALVSLYQAAASTDFTCCLRRAQR
jgi:hypothetical protein